MISAIFTPQARTKSMLAQADTLKPLPANIIRAIKLMEDPDATIAEVASVIALDQALTARILKLANSAYYGFVYPASTLHEAITRLGFRRTKTVLFTVSYSGTFQRQVAGYNLGRGVLWQHSVGVAMVAQRLSERVLYPAPDEAYIAGLLHDIGKMIIEQHFEIDWTRLLALGQNQQLMLVEAEQTLFDVNHAQVGGALADKWNLPVCLVDAITYHHAPALAPTSPKLAAVIHLADIIALRLGIGLAHQTFIPSPDPAGLDILGIHSYEADELTEKYAGMVLTIPMPDLSNQSAP